MHNRRRLARSLTALKADVQAMLDCAFKSEHPASQFRHLLLKPLDLARIARHARTVAQAVTRFKWLLWCEFAEACQRGIERGVAFAKGEAHLMRAIARIVVEAGAGNGGNADFTDQLRRKANVVSRAKSRNIGHDVIGAARLVGLEAAGAQ